MFYKNEKAWILSLATVLISIIYSTKVMLNLVEMILPTAFQEGLFAHYKLILIGIIFVANLGLWFLVTLIFYLLSVLFDTKGDFKSHLVFNGFGFVFLLIGAFVINLLLSNHAQFFKDFFMNNGFDPTQIELLKSTGEYIQIRYVNLISILLLACWSCVGIKVIGKLNLVKYSGFLVSLFTITFLFINIIK